MCGLENQYLFVPIQYLSLRISQDSGHLSCIFIIVQKTIRYKRKELPKLTEMYFLKFVGSKGSFYFINISTNSEPESF